MSNLDPEDQSFPARDTPVNDVPNTPDEQLVMSPDRLNLPVPPPMEATSTSAPAAPAAPAASAPAEPESNVDYEPIPKWKPIGEHLSDLYEASSSLDPAREGRLIRAVDKTGQPPEFVDKNLDAVTRGLDAKSPEFWRNLPLTHPKLALAIAGDPKHMAGAHDDVDNLVKQGEATNKLSLMHSLTGLAKDVALTAVTGGANIGLDIISKHGTDRESVFEMGAESVVSGTLGMGVPLNRVAPVLFDAFWYMPNLVSRLQGGSEVETPEGWHNNDSTRFWEILSAKWAPKENSWDTIDKFKAGQFDDAGRAWAAQILTNYPSQIIPLITAYYGGPVAVMGYAYMALQQTSEVAARGNAMGLSPTTYFPHAVAQGAAEVVFEHTLGTVPIWEKAGEQFAKVLGSGLKGKAFAAAMFKVVAHASFGEGIEEGVTTGFQKTSDYMSGIDPKGLDRIGHDMANAFLLGFGSSLGTTSPSAFVSGRNAVLKMQQAELAKVRVVEYVKAVSESQYRQRNPEGHADLSAKMSEQAGNVYMSKENFDSHAVRTGVASVELAKRLGAESSYQNASEVGDLIEIKTPTAANYFADSFGDVVDDMRVAPNMEEAEKVFSPREAKVERAKAEASSEVIQKEKDAIIAKLEEADAKLEAGARTENGKNLQRDYEYVKSKIREKVDAYFAGVKMSEKDRQEFNGKLSTLLANRALIIAHNEEESDLAGWWDKNAPNIKLMEDVFDEKSGQMKSAPGAAINSGSILKQTGPGAPITLLPGSSPVAAAPAARTNFELGKPIFSKVINFVAAKVGKNGADLNRLKSIVASSGMSKEERKWSGINDFIEARPGNTLVTKDELISYLESRMISRRIIAMGEIEAPTPPNPLLALPESAKADFIEWLTSVESFEESEAQQEWESSNRE